MSVSSASKTEPAVLASVPRPILVIEDDHAICELLVELLGDLGYTAISVHDGRRGVDAIRAHLPLLVLLDYNLPTMDGAAVLAAIATDDPYPPVVLMTADPRGPEVARSYPVAGFLAKPFDLDQAIQLIYTTVGSPRHA